MARHGLVYERKRITVAVVVEKCLYLCLCVLIANVLIVARIAYESRHAPVADARVNYVIFDTIALVCVTLVIPPLCHWTMDVEHEALLCRACMAKRPLYNGWFLINKEPEHKWAWFETYGYSRGLDGVWR